jgi:hypothetical protein
MTEYLVQVNGTRQWSSVTLGHNPNEHGQVVHSNGNVETLPYAGTLDLLVYCQSKPEQYTVQIVQE